MLPSFLKSAPEVAQDENNFGEQHVVSLENIPRELLRPIIEKIAGGKVIEWSLAVEQKPEGTKGYYGYKLIPTFRWKRADGCEGSTKVCVKAGPPEAIHYRGLAEAGFPVCRLYGHLPMDDGREVLFLEYLTNFQSYPSDDAGRRQWIELRARLNAIRPARWYDEELHRLKASGRKDSVGIGENANEFNVRAEWSKIIEVAKSGSCGETLSALCREYTGWVDALDSVAEQVRSRVKTMPLVLSNPELNPATRPTTNELACVDLHLTSLRPRAADVSQILGVPEDVRDGWGEGWFPRDYWAKCYVDAYNSVSDSPIRTDEILIEARTLWLLARLDQRWWLDRCQKGESGCCEDLASVMSFLRRGSAEGGRVIFS